MFADDWVSRPGLGELQKVLERMLQANSPNQVRPGDILFSLAGRRPRIPSRGSVLSCAAMRLSERHVWMGVLSWLGSASCQLFPGLVAQLVRAHA